MTMREEEEEEERRSADPMNQGARKDHVTHESMTAESKEGGRQQ